MLIRLVSPILLASAVAAKGPWSLLPRDVEFRPRNDSTTQIIYTKEQLFESTLEAVRVMQDFYFQPWVGTWPRAIDWTAAVMGSHIAGALVSLSRGLGKEQNKDYLGQENLISYYFTQLIGFYFGQNALSLRHQAYDDMLWVVLNWLDTVRFIDEYSSTRPFALYNTEESAKAAVEGLRQRYPWYGNQWIPSFAHRARIFWELASNGWDETLCGGGMFWNPRLGPYKNAITNELFISASISMYKYFPGDTNTSPYDFGRPDDASIPDASSEEWQPHDPKYLMAATKAYRWLLASNMTNHQGLFTDGFHMSNYPGNNTKCDRRDEMVYTYNQGVILTGQRELFRTTGNRAYLRQGHQLIQNVIRATGWNLAEDEPVDDLSKLAPGELPPHRGLGRAGILEEVCDPSGKCSQNSHTFKGIWMHHFTSFCASLDTIATPQFPHDEERYLDDDDVIVTPQDIRQSHSEACQKYLPWIRHNAFAAMKTRDREGRFGMWWTVGLLNITVDNLQFDPASQPGPASDDTVDYRTYGVPDNELWRGNKTNEEDNGAYPSYQIHGLVASKDDDDDDDYGVGGDSAQQTLRGGGILYKRGKAAAEAASGSVSADSGVVGSSSDPNERGRGRTVETQGGGLAVLRALWELLNQDS